MGITFAKYALIMTHIHELSQDTALRDIKELLERGVLAKNQSGDRSTSCRLADPKEA